MAEDKADTVAEWKACSPEELLSQMSLNTRMPDHLDSPPWRMPPDHMQATEINNLLGVYK